MLHAGSIRVGIGAARFDENKMHRDNDNDMQEALKDAIAADKPVFESEGPRKRRAAVC